MEDPPSTGGREMPSLPRIRRTRGRDLATVVAHPRRPAELSAAGLTWIHLDAPPLEAAQELAERFGWHPLDVEDVLSKRQRPKVDDYADEGYLFAVLHFPAYDPRDPAPERGRARRLRRSRLPRDAALGRAPAAARALPPLRGGRGVPRAALLEGLRPAALRGARRPLRLLLPDPRQDRAQARLARGRRLRGPLRRGRPRHLERRSRRSSATARSSSPSGRPCGCSSGTSSGSCPRSSSSTSTTSSTRPSGSGTSSTTTRK